MRPLLPVLAVLSIVVGSASPLAAQGADPAHGAEVERVARSAMSRLRSPVTPFHTLEICPSAEAAALRDTVTMAAAAGMSADEIVEDVIARRGEQLRILPEKRGVGLWAWVLPPLALAAGAVFLLLRLRSMRRADGPVSADAGAAPPMSDDDRARLAAAMAEWERTEGAT